MYIGWIGLTVILLYSVRVIVIATSHSPKNSNHAAIHKTTRHRRRRRHRHDRDLHHDSVVKDLLSMKDDITTKSTLVSGYGSRHHPSLDVVNARYHDKKWHHNSVEKSSGCYVRLVPSLENNVKVSKSNHDYESNTNTNNVCMEFHSMTLNTTILVSSTHQQPMISSTLFNNEAMRDHRGRVTENSNQSKQLKNKRNNNKMKQWTPVEGLFGIYQIPSGSLYVWIAKSVIVYDAPSSINRDDVKLDKSYHNKKRGTNNNRWWTIRKITHLHIIHIPNENSEKSLVQQNLADHNNRKQNQQQQEEKRQIGLLRHALKCHEWYYCTSSNNNNEKNNIIIPDMTYNLQQSMLMTKKYDDDQHHNKNNHHERQKSSWFRYNMNKYYEKYLHYENKISMNDNYRYHSTIVPWWDITDDDDDAQWNATIVHQNDDGQNVTNDDTNHLTSDSHHESRRQDHQIRPDSRFFWNEFLIVPLLDDLKKSRYNNNKNNSSSSTDKNHHLITTNETAMAIRTLLYHTIPVTSAFCGVQENISIKIDGVDSDKTAAPSLVYDEILITRRSKYRAGTRYTKRGADSTGAVANYAETEHVLFIYNYVNDTIQNDTKKVKNLTSVTSYLQTRGSIPLRWSSPTDIKTYRPRVLIGTDPIAQARALYNHLIDQIRRYCILRPNTDITTEHGNNPIGRIEGNRNKQKYFPPSLLLVNLIDKKSDQGRLGRALDAVLQAVLDVYITAPIDPSVPHLKSTDVQHLWFDFHAELKGGRWDRLSILLDEAKPSLTSHCYFQASPISTDNSKTTFQIEKLQNGIIRTNCMDCLDRTNVVQSIFSRYILFQQISSLKKKDFQIPLSYKVAFRQASMALPWIVGERSHRLLWADNADSISRLYAGTPALKGDYTRTGKRTKKGSLDDGMNSLQRYYLNNFLDADRQEGIDLLIGHTTLNNLNDINDDDDEEEKMAYENSKPVLSDLIRQGMSVKDAARFMLLGMDRDDGYKHGDHNHVRIKFTGEKSNKHRLDLRWLPGDLQNQFRSSTFSHSLQRLPDDYLAASESLQAIERRAATNIPWWVVPEESTNEFENNSDSPADKNHIVEVSTTSNNAGYVFGALMAGANAPIPLAMLVISLVAIGFPMFNMNGIDE